MTQQTDPQPLVDYLASEGITDLVTDRLIRDLERSLPYLPVLYPGDFYEFLSRNQREEIESILGVSSSYSHTDFLITRCLSLPSNSSLRAIHNKRLGAHKSRLYNPKEYISQSLITLPFVDYVVDSGLLTDFALNQLDECLKANNIDYNIAVPALVDPGEQELLDAILDGMLNMVKAKPGVFQREVADVMRARGIDPQKYNRTKMMEALDAGVKITRS